jgi:hypothetical protein
MLGCPILFRVLYEKKDGAFDFQSSIGTSVKIKPTKRPGPRLSPIANASPKDLLYLTANG